MKFSHTTEHFGVQPSGVPDPSAVRTTSSPLWFVRDLDHGSVTVATCTMESTAILVADLLNGHRQACRQVATIHRPTVGVGD